MIQLEFLLQAEQRQKALAASESSGSRLFLFLSLSRPDCRQDGLLLLSSFLPPCEGLQADVFGPFSHLPAKNSVPQLLHFVYNNNCLPTLSPCFPMCACVV